MTSWHKHILRVHYKDTDQMGVAHHANYVSWFEIGRTEYMRDKGVAYKDMETLGLLLPVLDLNVTYHKPARYDDEIAVYTSISEVSRAQIKFDYHVHKCDVSGKEGLLTSGSTLHMWITEKWRPARLDRIAPEVYELLKSL